MWATRTFTRNIFFLGRYMTVSRTNQGAYVLPVTIDASGDQIAATTVFEGHHIGLSADDRIAMKFATPGTIDEYTSAYISGHKFLVVRAENYRYLAVQSL